jgi:hypothetical protein
MVSKHGRNTAINYALKICISVFFLVASYYALQMIILKGNLITFEPILMSLFYLNCIVIGLKIFKK